MSNPKPLILSLSSSVSSTWRAALPAFKSTSSFSRATTSIWASLLVLAVFLARSIRFSIWSMSAKISSRLITSISCWGSTTPETWMISSSSKQRTTWTRVSTSRMWDRNLLPKPSPWLAPLTNPAISTNSTRVGTTLSEFTMLARTCNRSSGTETLPTFGSIVQNG